MKIEVQGKVVEVDDSFADLSPEKKQATVDEIANSLSPQEKSKFEDVTGISETSPLLGGAVGAVAGIPAGHLIEGGAKAAMVPPKSWSSAPGVGGGGEKWLRNWAGMDRPGFVGGVPEASSAYERTKGHGKVSEKVTQRFGPEPKLTIADYTEAQRARPLSARIAARTPDVLRRAGQAVQGVGASIPAWVGRGVAGGSAGFQGVDAANRFREGDVLGSVISGLGALGSGAALIPHPLTRGLGTAVGVGAPLLNELIDRARRQPKQQPYVADESNAMPMAAGGLAYLANGKKVKEAFEYGGKQLGKLSDWAQDYINSYLVPTQSDRMRFVGGPSFSANQLGQPEYKNIVWGSGKPGTASGIANLAKDPRFGGVENQVFAPLLGEAKMHQSNKIIYDRMLEDFFKNPENLTPELRQRINDYIQSGGLTVSGAKKTKGFEPIEGFDVADRKMLEDLGKTFENRKIIAQHAFGGKDIGGRKAQIIPYEKILQETTDPTVLGAPTFSIGPRAFKLSGETLDVPRHDLNPAYPYKLLGQDLGVTYTPTPSELSLMDFQRKWRQDTGKTMPLKSGALPQPGYYEHTMGYTPAGSSERVYPRQKITEEWIKELQRSGHCKGGLA